MAQEFWKNLSITLTTSLSVQAFKPTSLIFPIVYLAVMVFVCLKQVDFSHLKEVFANRWLYILFLLILPFLFAVVRPFDGEVLGFFGEIISPVVPLLSLVPLMIAIGTLGPLIGILLGVVTGLAQILALGQDLSAVLFYPGMSLLFAILINETPEDTSNWRTVLSKLFEAGMLSLPFWMLWQFNLAFVHGLRDVILILSQAIFLWVTHLPELLISGAALYLFMRFLKEEWTPKKFLIDQGSGSIFNAVIMQINELSKGNFDFRSQARPRTNGEKAIFDSLENLRQSLQMRTDTQSRLLSVDPTHYSREGYDLVMASILRAALTRDASSARIVLLEAAPQSRKPEMRLRTGQGEQTRNYAYLDTLILEKMADQEQLVLSNIKIDQYFGLTPGTPYPQALIALQLSGEASSQGILWVGFEQNHWFDQEDILFYQQLAYRASAALSTKEQISKVQNEKGWLNLAFDAFSDPILIINKDGQILFSNSAANAASDKGEALFGKKGSEVRIVNEKLNSLLSKDKKSGELKPLQLDGNKTYEVLRFPFQQDQEKQGEVVLLRDTSWLQKLNSQKNEFVSNISHDLRAPLWLMKGHTKLLSNIGKLSPEQRKYVEKIDAGIDTMTRLVDKVLNLERLDGDGLLVYNTFSIQETIDDTIKLLGVQAQQKKISLNVDYGGLKSPNISADQVMVQQALYNLIENAIKFSPRGESVLISVERDASWMHVAVKDNGKGIAPLDQPKLFTRFFHVDDDLAFENRGQGLGLSIVKSVADKHGGNVSVKSTLGEGSTFYLDLPLHRI